MAGAHRDPLRVEQRGHVVGMELRYREGDHRSPVRGRRRSVHLHPWNGRKSLERLSGERPPVLRDALHPELLEVLDRGGEPDRFGDRRGSGLEAPRQVVPLSPVDPDLLDHLASAASGLQGLENFARSEEHTSELQSHSDLVCRLLLEKKKKKHEDIYTETARRSMR